MGGLFSSAKRKKMKILRDLPEEETEVLVGVATDEAQLKSLWDIWGRAQWLNIEHRSTMTENLFYDIMAFRKEAAQQGSKDAMIKYLKKNAGKLQDFDRQIDAIKQEISPKLEEAPRKQLQLELAAQKKRIAKESGPELAVELGSWQNYMLTDTHLIVKDSAGTVKKYAVDETVKIKSKAGTVSFVFKGKKNDRTIKTDTGTVGLFKLNVALSTGTIVTSAHDAYSNLYDGYAAYDQYEYDYDDVFAGYPQQNALVSQGSGYHYQGNVVGDGGVGYDGFAVGVVAVGMVLVVCLMAALCFVFGGVFGFLGKVIVDKIKVNDAGNEAEKRRDIGVSVL